jgi:hypothetical protein
VRADLDTLLTAIYVLIDDFLPERTGAGRPPQISDAELITLAIAQVFMEVPGDRKFLGFATWRLGHLFPYLPQQPAYNKRLRALVPHREVAREMLERVSLEGFTVIADKGFAGKEFEAFMADRGATFLRPDRKDEKPRFGSLGTVRQWIESVFWTCKGQLGLERHGARTLPGLCARIGMRLLALSAGLWHNWQVGDPGRHFAAYGH